MICICFTLTQFLALPFALNNEHVNSIDISTTDWIGSVAYQDWGVWIDYAFLLLLGGIPWQCYYQRVLSSKTTTRAQMLSYGGGEIGLFLTYKKKPKTINLICCRVDRPDHDCPVCAVWGHRQSHSMGGDRVWPHTLR